MYTLDDIRRYREKYGKNKLVLDTNLFILLLVGAYDKNFFKNCSATKGFCSSDYDLLLEIFKYFDTKIIITPHILTEISNLSRRDIKKPEIDYFFKVVVDQLKSCKEESVSLERLLGIKIEVLTNYGFPDMSIIEVAKKMGAVILTNEINLCGYANLSCVVNINFSNIKANQIIKRS